MTDPRVVRRRCEERGCRITWAYHTDADEGEVPRIEVDHRTTTQSGSRVYVERHFPGEIVRDGQRHDWTPEQTGAVAAWVEQLHRMPLEEIP